MEDVVVLERYAFRWLNHELVELIDIVSGERRNLGSAGELPAAEPLAAAQQASQPRAAARGLFAAPPPTRVRRRFGNRPAESGGWDGSPAVRPEPRRCEPDPG